MVEIVQGDPLNRNRIATAVCVPLTTNLRWADAPGNVLLSAVVSGLPEDSVAKALQQITIDRRFLADRVKKLPPKRLEQVIHGIDVVLGR